MSFGEAMELLDRIEQTTETIYVASVFNSRTQVRLREIQNDVDRLRKLTLAARPAGKARAEQLQRDFDLVYEANANWCARCERAEAALREAADIIADDTWAITFQTMGQYRAAILLRLGRALSGARPGETT